MLNKIFALAVALIFSSSAVFAATYQVDNVHSQVHFKVAHLMISSVRGEFNDYTATIDADPKTRTVNSLKATIKTASIDTKNKKRDDHLRSGDFFNVAEHAEMTFESIRVVGKGDDIAVYGKLTIRGTTKVIELKGKFSGEVKDPWGNTKAGFEATGMINRKDFGLTWNKTLETGGVVVGDQIEIGLEIEALKQ
jgi:polyisoprenoid-binding protein YceI